MKRRLPLRALFGHAGAARRCPLIEVKRTSQLRAPKSENGPGADITPGQPLRRMSAVFARRPNAKC
jgi:hypothetical protein